MDENYPKEDLKNAFYFMPDISGFSGFVQNTPTEHSIHIISELLEILLDNNVLEMKLAEIEGDALFMYTEKEIDFTDLENQVSQMFNAFHGHLKRYAQQRICSCGACSTAINLRLKFLVHYGRLDFIQVRDIKKPYGQDVNRIHRLLKNDVPLDEYLLLSHLALEAFELTENQPGLIKTASNYDINILPYYYMSLQQYKMDMQEENIAQPKIGIDNKADLIVQREIAAPLHLIYNFIVNFKYRKSWDKSLTAIQFEEARVNRIGAKHNCILGNRNIGFETSGDLHFQADEVYGEKTGDMPMVTSYQYYILLDAINENLTRVKILNFLELDWSGQIFKRAIYSKIQQKWKEKLMNLEMLSREHFKIKTN